MHNVYIRLHALCIASFPGSPHMQTKNARNEATCMHKKVVYTFSAAVVMF